MLWEAQFGDFANSAAGDHRQLHRRRGVEVGPDDPTHALLLPHGYEGARAGALQRADRALHPARGRRATSGSPTRRRRRSTSTCCDARRGSPSRGRWSSSRRRACCGCRRRVDARGAAPRASFQFVLDDPRVADREAIERLVALQRQALLRHRPARAAAGGRLGGDRRGSSSCTRSRATRSSA